MPMPRKKPGYDMEIDVRIWEAAEAGWKKIRQRQGRSGVTGLALLGTAARGNISPSG